ncbi:MAG: alpha/beta hydrolase [Chloroflexi bacterium]|nr:alpha/beta hydrolase [Chloroflexota bacterium]MCC6892889.1 alpha/beta fold hydrolase [Anaerolineae bacterium]
MRKLLTVLILGCLALLVIPAAAQDAAPTFETANCMFTLPTGHQPECGYLVVPEDRTQADSPTIKIATAIFRSENPDKSPYPLVYLEGGPGGSVLEYISLTFTDRFGEFIKDRDVIVFDQRGVGRSQPALDCEEVNAAILDTLDQVMTTDEVLKLSNDAIIACANRLRDDGVNLSAYNSVENAADINDMRIALGYDQLDLYGISYGTRLALTVMRDFPEALHSVIIDSINPPQTSYSQVPANYERALAMLFSDCAADTDCNTTYPDLEQVFYDTIVQLNENPVTFEVLDPTTQREREVKLDGDGFAGYIFEALYATEILPELPKNIYDIHNGDTRFLSLWTLLKLSQLDAISTGMNYAVQCTEEMPFDTAEDVTAALEATNPLLQGFARRGGIDLSQADVCKVWNDTAPNPIENEIVKSDVPTLVVSGDYDPITPPANGEETAANLSNAYFFEFPGTGHGVIPSNACATSIAQAFLKDPNTEPDSACLADVTAPDFVTGEVVAEPVELEPFTNETAGFTTVKPVGWQEAVPGTYARASSPLDAAAISYQVIPGGNVDLVLPLIGGQFGIDTSNVETREANGLNWRILRGELQGIPVHMAITDRDGKIYLILLLSNENDKDILEETLLMPAVDAFVPNE